MVLGWLLAGHIAILGGWVFLRAELHRRMFRRLPAHPPAPHSWPSVLVLVPARNEEEGVAACLRSLLAQDYPGRFAIVAANDHSEDATGAIMRGIARGDGTGRLSVFDVPDLPAGWMGKNHALHCAVARAPFRADLLLFTDADILFAPSMVRRSVALFVRLRADHLFAAPALVVEGFWERAVLPLGTLFMMSSLDPRRIESPSRAHFMGVGAFNLLRGDWYARIGGHAAIRGEVLDDVALGRRTKELGGRLRGVHAGPALRVRMYRSLGGIVDGFTKNFHAAIGGGFARSFVVALLNAGLAVALPAVVVANAAAGHPVGVVVAAGWYLAFGWCIVVASRPVLGRSLWPAVVAHPLGLLVHSWIAVRSAWVSSVRKEIHWRGRRLPRPPQRTRMRLS